MIFKTMTMEMINKKRRWLNKILLMKCPQNMEPTKNKQDKINLNGYLINHNLKPK